MIGWLAFFIIALTVWRLVVRATSYDWERMRPVAHFIRLTVWEDVRYVKNWRVRKAGMVTQKDPYGPVFKQVYEDGSYRILSEEEMNAALKEMEENLGDYDE